MIEAATQPWRADHRLDRLLQYWQDKCPAADRLPSRSDLDPLELGPAMLPYIALIEVVDGGARFRFRLVGTRLNADAGLDLTGRYVDELKANPDYTAYISSLYRMTLAARQPTYSETRYHGRAGRIGRTRRLLCPLAADGQTIDMFVCAQVMENETALGEPPTMNFAASFEGLGVTIIPL